MTGRTTRDLILGLAYVLYGGLAIGAALGRAEHRECADCAARQRAALNGAAGPVDLEQLVEP